MGLIVAAALLLGSLPLFFGLAVVMPVLGHATWRFYRKAIERDPAREAPVEGPLHPDVTGNPVLRLVWIFLDALDYLRQGKEPTDLNASNGEVNSGPTKPRAGAP